MNYYFTGLLIVLMVLLALFVKPAHARNEYLNDYGVRCGEVDFRVEQKDQDYNYSDSNTNEQQNFSITFRKYLGTDCKTSKENVAIKQQLELMKMCGRVNSNPSLANNQNFRLLVSKCRGVSPARDTTRPEDDKSHWDNLKDDFKKENPDVEIMGDKILLPPKDYKMPVPE